MNSIEGRGIMTKQDIINGAEELKQDLFQSHKVDQRFYEELLEQYSIQVWALKLKDDLYSYEQTLQLQDEYEKIEQWLPRVSEDTFDRYVVIGDLIAVLLEQK